MASQKEILQDVADFLLGQYSEELSAVIGNESAFRYNLTSGFGLGNFCALQVTMAMNAECNYLFDTDMVALKKQYPLISSVQYSRYELSVNFKIRNYADVHTKQKLAEAMRGIAAKMTELGFYPCCEKCGEKAETAGHRIQGELYQVCDACLTNINDVLLKLKEKDRKEAPNAFIWGLIAGVAGMIALCVFRPSVTGVGVIGIAAAITMDILYVSFGVKGKRKRDLRFIPNAVILICLGFLGCMLSLHIELSVQYRNMDPSGMMTHPITIIWQNILGDQWTFGEKISIMAPGFGSYAVWSAIGCLFYPLIASGVFHPFFTKGFRYRE